MDQPPRIIIPPSTSAAGPTPAPVPPLQKPPEKNGRALPIALIGGVALLSVGAIGFAAGQRSSDSSITAPEVGVLSETTTTAAPTTVPPTTSPTTAAPTTAAPTTTAPTTTQPPTTAAPTATTTAAAPAVLAGPPLRNTGTVRHAVLEAGILYLRGRVPSEEFGAEIARLAGVVVGDENVINQYQVDESAAPVDSAPLYVSDTVLFPTGGVDINPAFVPLLDLGTKLLSVNDAVSITVVAHTDSAGSAGLNLRLSQARADTVRQYWIDQGVNGTRIVAEGRGESEPVGDNGTAEGKQANRRAEFIVTGILG